MMMRAWERYCAVQNDLKMKLKGDILMVIIHSMFSLESIDNFYSYCYI